MPETDVDPATGAIFMALPPEFLERDDVRYSLNRRDFGTVFFLANEYAGFKYYKIGVACGMSGGRVGEIASGKHMVEKIEKIEEICDGLRIPGWMVRIAPRPWEPDSSNSPVDRQRLDVALPEAPKMDVEGLIIGAWSGRDTRALRMALRMTMGAFAKHLGVVDRTIERWEKSPDKEPGIEAQQILDAALNMAPDDAKLRFTQLFRPNGPITSRSPIDAARDRGERHTPGSTLALPAVQSIVQGDPLEVAELLRMMEMSDVGEGVMEMVAQAVERLCCAYATTPAPELLHQTRAWIKRAGTLLEKRTTLAQHRELLVCSGWLFLLAGCVEYDMGWRESAEVSRLSALRIGRETGHGEIQAWSWEMAAWFALTQGQFSEIIDYTNAGQQCDSSHSVSVQLYAQEAKAHARMGDGRRVHETLELGRAKLGRLPKPDHPENHFVIDPDKWDFYAMDAYRLLGDDDRAAAHAREVLRVGQGFNGQERSPMRMAEARLTLGVTAARMGELEEAVAVGSQAFDAPRKSLPSLLLVADDLRNELRTRYPNEASTKDYLERLAVLSHVDRPALEP